MNTIYKFEVQNISKLYLKKLIKKRENKKKLMKKYIENFQIFNSNNDVIFKEDMSGNLETFMEMGKKEIKKRDINFSVVMPIYNEADYLYYSLSSIYRLNPDEVILIFDRCTDNSKKISIDIARSFRFIQRTKFIELNEPATDWLFRKAYLRRYGYKQAKNDVILNVDADMYLDPSINKKIQKVGMEGIGIVSFGYIDKPYSIRSFIRRILTTFIPLKGFSGLFAFSKKAWLDTESEDSAKKIILSEDSHLCVSIMKKYRKEFFNTKTLHLRPNENMKRHYMRGIGYWKTVQERSILRMFLHSIIMIRPAVMAGYLYAKSHL
ncbi:MAG: glycosyltransferase [Candidatus Hodarchaeota archaeon]